MVDMRNVISRRRGPWVLATVILGAMACEGDRDVHRSDAFDSATTAAFSFVDSDTWDDGATLVACHPGTCDEGEWCVIPGASCDYRACATGGAAEWKTAPPHCAPMPTSCVQDGHFDLACLEVSLCEAPSSEPGLVSDAGIYVCYPEAIDCFC